jgi:hypothetical protein
MIPWKYASAALGALLLIVSLLYWSAIEERDDLRIAASISGHARDADGRQVTLATKAAVEQIRILGNAVDAARQASAEAAAADANHALKVERADTQTSTEVSNDVQRQLDQTRTALADSRALAAERLRELAQTRADQGGGGDEAVPEDPDATCRAVAAASCDEILALLAEAESNTAALLGWQRFWPEVKANHDDDPAAAPMTNTTEGDR